MLKKNIMNHILQNVKLGFDNMKELFGIFLSNDDYSENNYDLYINSADLNIAKTAQELKKIEEIQESKRLSILGSISKKRNNKKQSDSK